MGKYESLRSEAQQIDSVVLSAEVVHDCDGVVDHHLAVFYHGVALVERGVYWFLDCLFVHDVLEVHLEVVEQIPDGLALPADVEVVHLQRHVLAGFAHRGCGFAFD